MIVDLNGEELFSVDNAAATNSAGQILTARGTPAFDGDEMFESSLTGMSDDEKSFHRVMATMFGIRNQLMYNIEDLDEVTWNSFVTPLAERGIKETTFTGGPTPKDNYYSRDGIFELAKNPNGRDIHHDVMKFLEEAGLYLLCHVTSIEFSQMLADTHPEGHDPCEDAGIENKIPWLVSGFPKICQPWMGIQNRPDSTTLENIARHDLYWGGPWASKLVWETTEDQPYQGLSTTLVDINNDPALTQARQLKEELLNLNPKIKTLISVEYRDGIIELDEDDLELWEYGHYPPDSPFWLWDANGDPVPGWGEDSDKDGVIEPEEALAGLVDFTKPELIELIAQKALSLKESGIVDGIFLDWWNEHSRTAASFMDWSTFYLTQEEELESRLAILHRIRELVGDEFLILVNTNEWKVPLSAPYVNGTFMELYKPDYSEGYTVEHLIEVENTLHWASENLQKPRINCLEGWRVVYDYGNEDLQVEERDSEENQQWMRVFTTIALTHSDGHVVFGDDNAEPTPDHYHNWYDFWDADLGLPVGEKRQLFNGIEGLFIREFTNGYAVYNRSGSAQVVSFENELMAVSTKNFASSHEIQNLDGEIFIN